MSRLVKEADVVYSHAVLYSRNGGVDIRQMLSHRKREKILSDRDFQTLEEGFTQAEEDVINEACKITPKGHVVWFTYNNLGDLFGRISKETKRRLKVGKVLRFGFDEADQNSHLNLYHLASV